MRVWQPWLPSLLKCSNWDEEGNRRRIAAWSGGGQLAPGGARGQVREERRFAAARLADDQEPRVIHERIRREHPWPLQHA